MSQATGFSTRGIWTWYDKNTRKIVNDFFKCSSKVLPSTGEKYPHLVNAVKETPINEFHCNNEQAGTSKSHDISSYGSFNLNEQSTNSKNWSYW